MSLYKRKLVTMEQILKYDEYVQEDPHKQTQEALIKLFEAGIAQMEFDAKRFKFLQETINKEEFIESIRRCKVD